MSLTEGLLDPQFSLLFGGEQVLSWQSLGGALTTCELWDAPLFGASPDRARFPPREKVSRCLKACQGSETEGLLSKAS